MASDLFEPEPSGPEPVDFQKPLASRMRPRTLGEYAGQSHIIGEGRLLRRAIEADRISSILLFGPPGTGKTSLARIIATTTRSRFETLNAVESGTAEVRRIISAAQNRKSATGHKTVLFIDEIHRFNKAQQDVLLPEVEEGTLCLIGATTHNPHFYVNPPLVSRSQVFELKPLSETDIAALLRRSLTDPRGLAHHAVEAEEEALQHLARVCDGDARKALNALEVGVLTSPPDASGHIHLTLAVATESIQKTAAVYDADEDEHYDTISAFIKSMRGSDPDAALYWLAKMLTAGEDLRFIARRIVICAAEDVGMADPQAMLVAAAAQQAVEFVGMPEARIPLAVAVVYIATAPKSNAAYVAVDAAIAELREGRSQKVPQHLRDGHYKGAKSLGAGVGYKYAHDFEDGYVPQDYMEIVKEFYKPTGLGYEDKIKKRLEVFKQRREESRKKPA
ncbi:MAG: replication-associated recombination protein A [Verrucomicrobiae bacterium]|nr:replication-associated recombination protein A [Verrucomicrobiae bacterium]